MSNVNLKQKTNGRWPHRKEHHEQKAPWKAAGLGTSASPATKAPAKEMLPIVDKPTIQFIVEEASSLESKTHLCCYW